MGKVDLTKLTQGTEWYEGNTDWGTLSWNFTLTGPGVDEADTAPPSGVTFNDVYLIPGEEYTICETGIPAGWTLAWMGDPNNTGTPDTIIPFMPDVKNAPVDPTTGYSQVYDPNYVAWPDEYTNDTRCVNFVVDVGETELFSVDNQYPGGEPRTIGYWKNWNTCTGGSQWITAGELGGPAAGVYILDDLLNDPGYTIGILPLGGADCEIAVDVLDKRDVDSGKKMASDAAYGMAAQLLAAELNLSAGAETCDEVVDAVNAGQNLLESIDFDGTGKYLKGKKGADANALAFTLDTYNNGGLCTAP
jgi:hypothetical protein